MALKAYLTLRTSCHPSRYPSTPVCRSCFREPLHHREYCADPRCMALVRFMHEMEQITTIGDMR